MLRAGAVAQRYTACRLGTSLPAAGVLLMRTQIRSCSAGWLLHTVLRAGRGALCEAALRLAAVRTCM